MPKSEHLSIELEKSPVPIIWLDTSILLGLVNIRSGKKFPEAERFEQLFFRLKPHVQSGKIICPEGQQRSEFSSNDTGFSDALTELSLGIRAVHPATQQNRDLQKSMKAFLAEEKILKFSYQDSFNSSLCEDLRHALLSPFVITTISQFSDVWFANLKNSRNRVHQDWDALRLRNLANGTKFSNQLETEICGSYRVNFEAATDFLGKIEDGIESSPAEFALYNKACRQIRIFNHLAEVHSRDLSIGDFFRSPYYYAIPEVDITTKMTAALLTRERHVLHGDPMDIEHIAQFLPIASLIVVDILMKHLITDLGLQSRSKTRVCSIRDLDEIINYVDDI